MPTSYVSTNEIAPQRQFDAWCSWFQPVFTVAPSGDETNGFAAHCSTWKIGSSMLCRVATPKIKVVRNSAMIRRDSLDHWNIAIGLGGATTGLEVGSQSKLVPSGVPFLLSLKDPVSSEREADERLQVYFSRDRFSGLNASLEACSRQSLHTPLGGLLTDFLMSLERNIASLTAETVAGVENALKAMIGACLVPTRDHLAEADQLLRMTQMSRIRSVILQRLGSSRLGPAMLCRELGMSRSKLYRLMEGEGGVARYIHRLRLEAIFATLSDPTSMGSLASIATAHGFPDPSTFSRSFRREFGVPPSDVRAAAQVGLSVRSRAAPIFEADTLTLEACIRALG